MQKFFKIHPKICMSKISDFKKKLFTHILFIYFTPEKKNDFRNISLRKRRKKRYINTYLPFSGEKKH